MTLLSLLITQLEGKKGFLDCVTPIFVKYRTLVEPNLHLLISTKTNEPIILRQIKAGYIKLIQMLHNELKYNLQIIPGLPESTSMLIEAVKHQHLRVVTYLLHEIQVDVHYKDEVSTLVCS